MRKSRSADLFGSTLSARVVAHFHEDLTTSWPARTTWLTDIIDETTRAIGVVMQVGDAALPDPATQRPAPLNGGFVEVILTGPAQDNQNTAPGAIRSDGSQAYVLLTNPSGRLIREDMRLGAEFDEQITIKVDLAIAAQVILSDPRPVTLRL